jgi:hypothetical protein
MVGEERIERTVIDTQRFAALHLNAKEAGPVKLPDEVVLGWSAGAVGSPRGAEAGQVGLSHAGNPIHRFSH